MAQTDGYLRPVTQRIVDGVAFVTRLTDDEYAAILEAAQANIQVARWIDLLRLRGEIDLGGATAQAVKSGLVALGLIAEQRADQIFA